MKFWQEFKAFIKRGNVVDMAVGVIIGTAFGAIVTALTNKIIMPLINLLLSAGGADGLETAYTFLKKVYTDGKIDLTKSIYIDWGAFITAILNFLIIAMVLFIILKVATRADSLFKDTIKDLSNKELKKERAEVRKLAKEQNRPFVTVWREHRKEKEDAEIAKKEAEEKEKKDADYRNSTEGLLKEIRDLLKENQELRQSLDSKTENDNKD